VGDGQRDDGRHGLDRDPRARCSLLAHDVSFVFLMKTASPAACRFYAQQCFQKVVVRVIQRDIDFRAGRLVAGRVLEEEAAVVAGRRQAGV
jgi:hypothetical protein